MANFIANIQAVLDTKGIDSQIKNLQSRISSMKPLEISLKLSSDSLDIGSLNNILRSGLARTGQQAGQSFVKSLTSSLNNIHLVNGGIGNVKNILQGAGFDKSSINSITRDLDKMVLTINKINTTQMRNGNIRMNIAGIDELGRAVTIVRDFDKETGNVVNTTKSFAQSFKQVSGSIKSTLSNNIQAWMNKNGASANKFRDELKGLQDQLKGNISDEAYARIRDRFKEIASEVAASKAGVTDYTTALSNIQFKLNIGAFQTQVDSVQKAFDSLKNKSSLVSDNITRLQTALNTMNSSTATPEQKIRAYQEFNAVLSTTKTQISNAAKAENEYAKSAKEAAQAQATLTKSSTLSNNIQAWMNQNTKAAERYGEELKDLQAQLNNNSDPAVLRSASLRFGEIKSEAKAAGLVVNSFNKSLKETVTQLLGIGSTVAIIQQVIKMLKKMYDSVYEIDTALTELYKVTDETPSKYAKYLDEAKSTAQDLGRTVSSYIKQTATWSKLGFNIDEAKELSKLSSIYANVGEVGDERAVSDMVTAIKAFNIEASNAITIVDSLNELGNNFATSAGDLGEGLARSASSLHNAGADIYQTLALLTGGAEITQNANEFGNFLKISSMRIRGMKGQLEELGEEVDDSIESISKVQTQILNITHGKVNIFDDKGEFRNYYEIMKEISEIYNDLSSTEKASLTEILFGKQRGNQGSALIQAFQSGQIEKAYESAINSAGSAYKEQYRWMESLEAKTAQFKAAWESLSDTVLNSDFLKGLVDTGTIILNILDNIVQHIGTLNTLLLGFAAYKGIKSIS